MASGTDDWRSDHAQWIAPDRDAEREPVRRLYRWRCSCGRYGVWLERAEVARANGRAHQHSEHGSQEIYS